LKDVVGLVKDSVLTITVLLGAPVVIAKDAENAGNK
jgi:hypothetical protein